MNWGEYRKAMEALPFSDGFQERTEELVRRSIQSEKECISMKKRGFYRILAVAAAVAMLTVSAYAASRWLSPAQVADMVGNPALSRAFEGENAVKMNQSVQTGDLSVTLAGMVSGKNLSDWTDEADQSRTYAVMILESLDGTALNVENFPLGQYTFTPLVAGFTPWSVNSWTLDTGVSLLEQDGVLYYLLDVQNLEMFADHTVYVAFYQGASPSLDYFVMAEDGTISFAEKFEGPRALFTLPLEQSKADPAAVEQFMDNSGFDRDWFTTVAPVDDSQPAPEPGTSKEPFGFVEEFD
ncbi:MAG: hypothetical protein HFF56_04850 [Lawsonibacter sp.]|nr:hypothetical protein [Lawsonibacter sp.]